MTEVGLRRSATRRRTRERLATDRSRLAHDPSVTAWALRVMRQTTALSTAMRTSMSSAPTM